MTDIEIYEWLYKLKPESIEQENKIRAMLRIILYSPDNHVREFLKTLNIDDILHRPTREVYEKYCIWANDNKHEKTSHNIFSEAVQNIFFVKSKAARVNGKVTRIYKYL